ncbi:MAG: RsmB/NOP family class I SAM-dependent RNA methyltransferase, partial [Alphaproteobacteria bacterium]|nr:RsmB/NOP family class I SAM-dependent RNA methyltransferase [Alphaproteobacteria bacterium]
MLPSARVTATIELLERTATSRIPMDSATGDYMRQRRYIGSKDRAAIAARLYNIARARARLGWWVNHLGVDDHARNRTIIWLATGEGESAASIERLFDDSTYGAGELNDEDRALLAKVDGQPLEHPDMPDAIRAECPPEYEDALRS